MGTEMQVSGCALNDLLFLLPFCLLYVLLFILQKAHGYVQRTAYTLCNPRQHGLWQALGLNLAALPGKEEMKTSRSSKMNPAC